MPGSYTIKPIEAKLNSEAHFNQEMSPLCSFTFGNKNFISDTAKFKNDVPTWKSSVTIRSDADAPSYLRLDLMDKQRPDMEDLLGNCLINLKEIESKGQFKNWYPLRHNNECIGEILLDSVFEDDQFNKDESAFKADKQSNWQADASEKSKANKGKDRNQIEESASVDEGKMSENFGGPSMMSGTQRERYNNNGSQGMKENIDQPQWNKRREVNDMIAPSGQARKAEVEDEWKAKNFGDNIGANPNPNFNNNLGAIPMGDWREKKPAQEASNKNERDDQEDDEALPGRDIERSNVYSEKQSQTGNRMDLGLSERQNQAQKMAPGHNPSVEGPNKKASPSKKQKFIKEDLSNWKENDEKEAAISKSQFQPKSNENNKDVKTWDMKMQDLDRAEDEARKGRSSKQGRSADDKSMAYKGAGEMNPMSSGMQANKSGGSASQELSEQHPVYKMDPEKFDI